jgi:hypothetical protein
LCIPILTIFLSLGLLAQLAEHWIPNPKAIGSNPVGVTFLRPSVFVLHDGIHENLGLSRKHTGIFLGR